MEKNNTRDLSFDFVKGILIILVVWGHISCYTRCFTRGGIIEHYISLFEMPLFIFVSGYFQKTCSSFSACFSSTFKSLKRLIIPLFFWSLISLIFRSFDEDISIENFISCTFTFWFIYCLFGLILIYKSISYLSGLIKIGDIWFISFVFIIFLFKSVPFNIPFMYIFFIMGVYYHKKKIFFLKYNKSFIFKILLFICAFIFIINGFDYPFVNTFYRKGICIVNGFTDIYFVVIRYILYISAVILSFYIIKKIYRLTKDNFITKYIASIGRQTLFIYLAHVSIFNYIYRPFVAWYTDGSGFLTTYPIIRDWIVCLPISILIIYILSRFYPLFRKNRILSLIFLGER